MYPKWITIPYIPQNSALYIFEKEFFADGLAESFIIKASADTKYRLFINDTEVLNGPCLGSGFVKYFEETDCSRFLINGKNKITAQVFHAATYDHFGVMPRGVKPAFFFEGILATEKGEEIIVSDESFSVMLVKNIAFSGKLLPSVFPFEEVYGETETETLDCVELYTPHLDNNSFCPWGGRDLYPLEKRPIQLISPKEDRELSLVCEFFDESGNYNMVFDTKRYTTAMVTFDFLADKGVKLRPIYAECMQMKDADGNLYKDVRDDLNGVVDSLAFDLLYASGKPQKHSPLHYRAFRFIRVECSEKPSYFKVFAARYTYDFEKDVISDGIGSFTCSDENFNKMWEVSRNTIECTAHDIFADCPFYEQQQYVGDGRFEAIYAWRLSNDSKLQKKLIVDTAHSLQGDGQLAGNFPNVNIQVLVTAGPLYVNLMREYLRFTGDTEFLRSITGVCDRYLEFVNGTLNKDGLVLYPYGCRFHDWAYGWEIGTPKNSENVPLTFETLMYAFALKNAAEICNACGRKQLAEEYEERRLAAISAVNAHCFDQNLGLYKDGPTLSTYCEHNTVWAILSGAVNKEDALSLIKRTRDFPKIARCSFSKNYDLLRVFETTGCYEEYAPEILGQWTEMLKKHCTTWVEDPVTQRSECHGWSSVPMYEFSAKILGVKPSENGFEKILIKPTLLHLTYAKGRVPTPFGYVYVFWEIKNGKFNITITASKQSRIEVVCPSGRRETIFTDNYSFSEDII